MAVIELTSVAGAIAPRRRRARSAAAKLGRGLAVLVPIVLLSSFITYCLGALSNSNPAATILGQDAATPAAVSSALATALTVPLDSPSYPTALQNAVVTSVQDDPIHIWLYTNPRILAYSPTVTGIPQDLVQQRWEGVRVGS